MDKELFQIRVAQFFFDKLKISGSWIHHSRLQDAAKKEFSSELEGVDDKVFWGYTRRAEEILDELGLIKKSGNSLTLTANAFMMPDTTKILDIIKENRKKEDFENNNGKRKLFISIASVVIAFIGVVLPFLSNQGNTGQIIGWLLVGATLGYFGNELINKR